jgi:hypothetical protein
MCSSVSQIKPDPAWSPEDHLEHVYRRGRQLRRRRQVGATSAVLVAVVGLAVMVSGPTASVLQPLRTIAGAGGGGGGESVKTDTTSTTAADSVDDGKSDNGRQTSAAAKNTTTTHKPRTTTTVAPVSTTMDPNTPPPTSPLGPCKTDNLSYSTATNKSSYRGGDTVDISLRVHNGGDRPCYVPAGCGVALSARVDNANTGATVWRGTSKTTPCGVEGKSGPLLNGHDTYSYGVVGSWNQNQCMGDNCTGDPAPLGTYIAIASRGSTAGSGATFALR